MSFWSGALSKFLLFLLLCMASPTIFNGLVISSHQAEAAAGESNPAFDLKPVPELKSFMVEENRRMLGAPFQVCGVCTCCGGPNNICKRSPCCYGINCNIPNKPFGFCAFMPKSCDCNGCH